MLIDTHCHIHEPDYELPLSEVLERAHAADVTKMICVGTTEESSRQALQCAEQYNELFATVGVHPHDTKDGVAAIAELVQTDAKKLVAVGEIGLDYFYLNSPRETQMTAFEQQLQVAYEADLPVVFHVRDSQSANRNTTVWRDFWPIVDNFSKLRGVLHSFTDSSANIERGLARGFYVSVNGISTFTRDESQQAMFADIPLDRLLLETDAPFLTPRPFRGTVNEPCRVREVAKHQAMLRQCSLDEIARHTTRNAETLFDLQS
ncbi:MAG: TatD family hydrolase [Candidatus Saccharimonadales bacterium]